MNIMATEALQLAAVQVPLLLLMQVQMLVVVLL
jgi:hypothetical protein